MIVTVDNGHVHIGTDKVKTDELFTESVVAVLGIYTALCDTDETLGGAFKEVITNNFDKLFEVGLMKPDLMN